MWIECERISADKSWYMRPYWQEMEAEADDCLASGRFEDFDNMDEFIKSL